MSFKEKDIRDPDVLQNYFDLVAKDSAKMLASNEALENIDPKKWGLGETIVEFEKGGYNYEKCLDTGSLIVNPRPKFEALMNFYASSESGKYWVNEFFMPKMEARRKKIFKPRAEFVNNRFPFLKHMKVGDIGAGFGLFIDELQRLNDSHLNIEAIEPSHDMAAICLEKGIKVNENMLENLVGKKDKYDLLTSFELFEHLHDPLVFLEDCYKLLNPGGYLLITTLNSHGFDIQVLWEKSNSIFPPHHLNFFNPISMKSIMDLAGFENVEITTPGELDVDIVKNQFKSGAKGIPRFLDSMFKYASDDVQANYQQFLKSNNMSSHMKVIVQKPTA